MLWGFILLTGVFCGVFLGASPYQIILFAQAGNGVVLPLALILLLIVANRRAIMGEHRNGALQNVIGVAVVAVITALSLYKLAELAGLTG